jgi:hypothetical protein
MSETPVRGERGLRQPIPKWVAEVGITVTFVALLVGGCFPWGR